MKPATILSCMMLLALSAGQVSAQQERSLFSKGYNSSPSEIERYEDGTWLFITLHTKIPGEIYQDTMTVYHTDSTGQILRLIELTPPDNFEHFTIEDLVALPGGRFVAIYSGGDCDAGGYGYYAEARDTSGQLLWLTQLPMGYPLQDIGIGLDSNIVISYEAFAMKYAATDGSILWEAEHNDTYSYEVIFVPGTEDILLVDHTGLKYFLQDTVSGEITYQLQTFTPLEASQGILSNLLADGDSVFYAYKYFEKKLLRFHLDLQPALFTTLPKYPLEMVSGDKGVYTIVYEDYNSTKLNFIDSSGHIQLINHFKDKGLRPEKLLTHPHGTGLIGTYGSGPELPNLNGYRNISRSQAWFNYYPQSDFDEPADAVDLAVTQIIQQDSIQYHTFWSEGPFPAYLHNFVGGNFILEVTNMGSDTVYSFWVNIAFGANENTWFCPPSSVKQVFIEHLNLLPGESAWVDFGDIYAYHQMSIPDQYCFWTSGPNHLPDYFPDNDALCIDRIVAVEQIKENIFSIFPNPANDELLIEWKDDYAVHPSWTITDLYGRNLKKGQRSDIHMSDRINLTDLPSGLYVFTSGSHSRKIIVQH